MIADPDTIQVSDPTTLGKKLYFTNEVVEYNLALYNWTGCTNVQLRDEIMSHATELIRQIIRKQGLHTIYPGQEESAFGDLLQVAWCQIERTLYKYRACAHCRNCFKYDRPSESTLYKPQCREYGIITMNQIAKNIRYCPKCGTRLSPEPTVEPKQGTYGGSETILYRGSSKVFNLWSQVARTVILAYIKKEARDRKNCAPYSSHLSNKPKPIGDMMARFLTEARSICQFHDDYMVIVESLDWIIHNDDRPYDGIISKLTKKSNLSRSTITGFIRFLKLRSCDFSDSPISRNISENHVDRFKDEPEFEDE